MDTETVRADTRRSKRVPDLGAEWVGPGRADGMRRPVGWPFFTQAIHPDRFGRKQCKWVGPLGVL